MCMSAILGGATVASGLIGSSKAADAQEEASANQIALSRDIYNQQTDLMSPWVDSGNNALAAYNYELGLGPQPTFGGNQLSVVEENYSIPGAQQYSGDLDRIAKTNQYENMTIPQRRAYDERMAYIQEGLGTSSGNGATTGTRYMVGDNTFGTRAEADQYVAANSSAGQQYGGFEQSQDYLFGLGEGLDATQASAANSHGLVSGSALKSMNNYASGYASQQRNNYLNRLSGLSGVGQSAAAGTAAAAGNYASNANNAYANAGDATAAGWIGGTNALSSGLTNGLGTWAYQNALA